MPKNDYQIACDSEFDKIYQAALRLDGDALRKLRDEEGICLTQWRLGDVYWNVAAQLAFENHTAAVEMLQVEFNFMSFGVAYGYAAGGHIGSLENMLVPAPIRFAALGFARRGAFDGLEKYLQDHPHDDSDLKPRFIYDYKRKMARYCGRSGDKVIIEKYVDFKSGMPNFFYVIVGLIESGYTDLANEYLEASASTCVAAEVKIFQCLQARELDMALEIFQAYYTAIANSDFACMMIDAKYDAAEILAAFPGKNVSNWILTSEFAMRGRLAEASRLPQILGEPERDKRILSGLARGGHVDEYHRQNHNSRSLGRSDLKTGFVSLMGGESIKNVEIKNLLHFVLAFQGLLTSSSMPEHRNVVGFFTQKNFAPKANYLARIMSDANLDLFQALAWADHYAKVYPIIPAITRLDLVAALPRDMLAEIFAQAIKLGHLRAEDLAEKIEPSLYTHEIPRLT